LSKHRISEIKEQCDIVGMSIEQGLSLRKQLMVQRILERSKDLHRSFHVLKRKYNAGASILSLSKDLDQPPVALMRALLLDRVKNAYPMETDSDIKRLVKFGLRGEGVAYEQHMNERDRKELDTAKDHDNSSFSADPENERQVSQDWEGCLYTYLDTAGEHLLAHSFYS
jgi:hypothetical protein